MNLFLAGIGESVLTGSLLGLRSQEGHGDLELQTQIMAIYDEMRPVLFGNLIFLGFDVTDADDAIQEAFLGVLRHLVAGRKIDNIRGWVYRAVYSLSLNSKRQNQKPGIRGDDAVSYASELPALGNNPEQEYLHRERMRRYETAMERLSSQQRHCLLLRKEGLNYREIGEALGISTSRAAQLLDRAVQLMMEELRG